MVASTLVLALFAVTVVTCELESRMHNGEEIGDDFKFLVEIATHYSRLERPGICSGSILDKHWILTAAHCVTDAHRIRKVEVTRFGNAKASSEISVKSSGITSHPSFKPSLDGRTIPAKSIKFDLALLKTTQPIQFNQLVQPIALGVFSPLGQVLVAGYGLPVLQPRKGEMMLTYCPEYPALCSKRIGSMPRVGFGDSGGPVVMNGTLVGVVSCKNKPYGNTYLNLFADVQSNYNWIQSVMKM